MASLEESGTEESAAKRRKTSDEDEALADVTTSPVGTTLLTLGDPTIAVLPFLTHKDLWNLEATCLRFRYIGLQVWNLVESKIPEWNRCKKGGNIFGANMPTPDMAAPISIPKIRINKFMCLSKFAKQMEYQSRRHHSDDFTCSGCLDYPNADTDVFDLDEDHDVFYRISKLEEGTEESKVIWQGFLPLQSNKR